MAETERLLETSEIYFINGTTRSIDIFLNYENNASISDPTPLTVGDVYVADGSLNRPFDTYTFTVRPKDFPMAEPLTSASIPMDLGKSYTGVFHELPDGSYQFSIFENDLSRGAEARLTVRNTCPEEPITWFLTPNGDNPGIDEDNRRGALMSGEWQIARDVTINTYDLRIMRDGQVIAREPSLEIGLEQNLIVHVVGNPRANVGIDTLQSFLVIQELEYDPGPAAGDIISDAEPPVSKSDENNQLEFEAEPVELWEGESGETKVTARDPDGSVTSLSVSRIDPDNGGIVIKDGSVEPSTEAGTAVSGILEIQPDLPTGHYVVRIAANVESKAQSGFTEIKVKIKAIDPDRLAERVRILEAEGLIDSDTADELIAVTNKIIAAVRDDDLRYACSQVTTFVELVSREKDVSIATPAADELTDDAARLQANLGC